MVMYLGLTFSIAEMSPALPHTGAAYSFARTAMGPWGGFLTGLAENVEYVLTPAVIVFFIGSYMTGIFETPAALQPAWWIAFYVVFLWLNIAGVELSFRVTLVVTLAALAVLAVFYVSAFPNIDFSRWALNIGPDGAELPEGNGPFLPIGITGALVALPFAVWLFLAIEQLPLAAEESHDPKRDMPRGIIAGMFTLIVSAFLVLYLNPSVVGVGSFALGQSGEPLLDGFRAIFGGGLAKLLALIAVVGLIASFHTIIFAQGRQIYSLSRAGYFPTGALGHPRPAQDAARGDDHGRGRRPRRHARGLVRRRLRAGQRGHRRHAAQHGRVRRDVLLHHAGRGLHPPAPQQAAHRAAVPQPARASPGRSPPS